MGFQWDAGKEAANLAKHGVSFRQAVEMFRGFTLSRVDDRRDYGEVRETALGVYDGVLLRVVYTRRDGDIRIISAWKAGRYERRSYAEALRFHQI